MVKTEIPYWIRRVLCSVPQPLSEDREEAVKKVIEEIKKREGTS